MPDRRVRSRLRPLASWCAWAGVIVLWVVAWPGAAIAQTTDAVVMGNGDRLVGEVKGLRQGTLVFKTDTMGTVSIKWDRVEQLTAPRYFEVETTSGAKYYGTIQPGAARQLDVVAAGRVAELALASVVKIRPISQSFWQRLDGSISVGANYTLASGVGQGSLNANVSTRRETFELSSKLSAAVTIQTDQPESSRAAYSFTYSRFLQNRWFMPVAGQLDRNEDLGFRLRSSAGAGIGRYLIQTNRSAGRAEVGMRVNKEIPVTGDRTTNVEALFGADYSYFTYDSPKTNVTLACVVYPSLTVARRVRVDTDLGLSRELVKDFIAGVTLYDSYDSRPPAEGSNKNDFGFTVNVGWSF
jgi:putative salt-induced outer membrane protein YdiY